jgi:hypothetical protein
LKKLLLLLLIFPATSFALMELSGNYGYTKQVFGANDENFSVTRSYTATLAWYVFSTTAIEVYYSTSEDVTQINTDASDGAITIRNNRSSVVTNSVGGGIRQALAPRNSRFIPTISLGYVDQKQTGETYYEIDDGSTVTPLTIGEDSTSEKIYYATFSLRIKLTKALGLTGSATGFFDDFNFDNSTENVRYSAGLSWFF